MKARLHFLLPALLYGTLSLPAFAFTSGLTDAKGGLPFSKDFIRDYEAALKLLDKLPSAEPFLEMAKKYTKPEEQAELELSIGLVYSQRTGVVDPAKAIIHLSNALQFSLPEETQISIFSWRGGSQEQLQRYELALRDYLRGLLACSYYDLSGEWPEIKPSNLPIGISSDDPENGQRRRDYQMYRTATNLKRFLFMQRYSFIEAVRRVQKNGAIAEVQVRSILKELTPDESRYDIMVGLIKAENKRPWP
jgi:hypothetical protein